ncbi:cellulase family glycosylhydrolase [Microbacterium karelineae]|uniref:cellulase family glycosylhydrolase n=1 Tax=Microbacterium karelineae TaxID=2654283 RepID=UPI0012E9D79E|nr:cellulase family glycosylhydrolase [Microbacterium karelineae]
MFGRTAFALVAATVALTSALTASGAAAEDEASTYTTMALSSGGVAITGYSGGADGADLVIPDVIRGERVRAISDSAFAGAGLSSVVIPPSVGEIGSGAFRGNGLTAVTLGNPSTARPVDEHGGLSVSGRSIVDADGQDVQLRGISLFHSNWGGSFFTPGVVDELVDEFEVSVIRAPANVEAEGGYLDDPEANYARVAAVVDQAIERGVYVVVDWHSHEAQKHVTEAREFFDRFSSDYADVQNVIYEVYNEPREGTSWSVVKRYASQMTRVIRENSPDSLIIVGTPNYSGHVDIAADDPLDLSNIAYALHFYADGGGQSYVRARVAAAYEDGLPMFVSEWGVGDYSGRGRMNETQARIWTDFLDARGISSIMWSVSRTSTPNTVVTPRAGDDGGWQAGHLTPTGLFIRGYLRRANATTVAPDAFAENKLRRIEVRGRVYGLEDALTYSSLDSSVYARLVTVPSSNPFGHVDIPGAVIVNPALLVLDVRSAVSGAPAATVRFTGDGLSTYSRAENPMSDFARYYRVGETRDSEPMSVSRLGRLGSDAVTFDHQVVRRDVTYDPSATHYLRREAPGGRGVLTTVASFVDRSVPVGVVGGVAVIFLVLTAVISISRAFVTRRRHSRSKLPVEQRPTSSSSRGHGAQNLDKREARRVTVASHASHGLVAAISAQNGRE